MLPCAIRTQFQIHSIEVALPSACIPRRHVSFVIQLFIKRALEVESAAGNVMCRGRIIAQLAWYCGHDCMSRCSTCLHQLNAAAIVSGIVHMPSLAVCDDLVREVSSVQL